MHVLSLIRDHLEQEINATKAKLTLVDTDLSTLTGCQIMYAYLWLIIEDVLYF